MSKAKKYGMNGAILGGIGNVIINLIRQFEAMDGNPELKFSWKELLFAAGKGALVGGGVGYTIGAIADYNNGQIKPVNTDAFLFSLVSNFKLDKNDTKYLLLNERANWLISLLTQEFGADLRHPPMKMGSTEKGTAIRDKFDMDIALPFKHDSFRSTEEMFDAVYDFLDTLIGKYSITEVRDQKKSIGVLLNLNGGSYKIDVVPYKITKSRGNKTSGYLYVNNTSLLGDNSTYTKTDIHVLTEKNLSETQRKIVIILKHWKQIHNLPMSSHLLENLVKEAYRNNSGNIPRSITKKVIMVLEFIANNLDGIIVRSIENTNNILTNISEDGKRTIIDACVKAIEEYNYQPNSILDTLAIR